MIPVALSAHGLMDSAMSRIEPWLLEIPRIGNARRRRSRISQLMRADSAASRAPLALHVAAVNQSLAVMSRGGVGAGQLRAIVDVTLDALAQTLGANDQARG